LERRAGPDDHLDQRVRLQISRRRAPHVLRRDRPHAVGVALDVVVPQTEVLDLGEKARELRRRVEPEREASGQVVLGRLDLGVGGALVVQFLHFGSSATLSSLVWSMIWKGPGRRVEPKLLDTPYASPPSVRIFCMRRDVKPPPPRTWFMRRIGK